MGGIIIKKYTFGIIGCGMIANIHAAAIHDTQNAVLGGAFDPIDSVTNSFCEKWNTKKFSSVEEMLNDMNIDVVCICTPSGTHAELSVRAMENGKHVIVEKPMALNKKECDLVCDTQNRTGKKCVVISQLRFSDTSKKVKEAISQNKLGKLVEASAIMKFYRSEEYYSSSNWKGTWAMDGGGALMNQGIHGIDLLLYYMGDIKSVFAICKTMRHNIEVEDTAVATVEFKNGAVGIIEGTTSILPGYPRQISICGTDGSIILEEDSILKWDIEGEFNATGNATNSSFADPTKITFAGHKSQIENLINHLENGEEILIDAFEGRRSVELICAIYESSKQGVKIEL